MREAQLEADGRREDASELHPDGNASSRFTDQRDSSPQKLKVSLYLFTIHADGKLDEVLELQGKMASQRSAKQLK